MHYCAHSAPLVAPDLQRAFEPDSRDRDLVQELGIEDLDLDHRLYDVIACL